MPSKSSASYFGGALFAAADAVPFQFRQKIAGDAQGMHIVAREIFAEAGGGHMEICAAKFLVGRILADGGFHQRRAGQKNLRLVLDQDHIIRQARQIRPASRG